VSRIDRWTGRQDIARAGGWIARRPPHQYAVIISYGKGSTMKDADVEMVEAPSLEDAQHYIGSFGRWGTVWAVREVDPRYKYTVVFDNPDIGLLGYVTFNARDGQQALEIARLFHAPIKEIKLEKRVTVEESSP
jgi:hypothetical protein